MTRKFNSFYIHGSDDFEQSRLTQMNEWINPDCLREVGVDPGSRILDLGSGLGQFSMALAQASQPEGYVIAVERDPRQLLKARQLLQKSGLDGMVEFRQGDVFDLPLESQDWESFDIVHARFLLEHIPDPASVVSDMVRAARSGGRIILLDDDHSLMTFTPEPGKFRKLWDTYIETYKLAGNDPFVGRRLVQLLVDAGATPTRVRLVPYCYCQGGPGFDFAAANIRSLFLEARRLVLDQGLLSESEHARALQCYDDWCRSPAAVIWYAINLAEGQNGDTLELDL